MKRVISYFILLWVALIFIPGCETRSEKPNVILVMTDDQGYVDLACHGNPWIKIPNLDDLYGISTRLTDFHVSPTCHPPRAALMTGR
jgi:arylsulfatase A-like enzyme